MDTMNETTIAAIEEGRNILNDPTTPRYSDIDSLKVALDVCIEHV